MIPLVIVTVLRGGAPVPHVAVLAEGTPARAPSEVRVEEVQLSFVPKVQIAAPGSTLVVHNRDDETHTVHATLEHRTLSHTASVPGGGAARILLDKPGVVTLTCELHSYMRAWIVVAGEPFAAVTDLDGHARLDLPPGRHKVRAVLPGVEVSAELDGDLTLELPAAPAAEAPPPAGAPAPPHRHGLPSWLSVPSSSWPRSAAATLALSALAMTLGVVGAALLLRQARRRGWSLAATLGLGSALTLASVLPIALGLHLAVAAGLGLGLFIGLSVFAAAWR
jgi:plastocyanin